MPLYYSFIAMNKNRLQPVATFALYAGFFLFLILLLPQAAQAQEVWNSSDWTLYDTITIDADNIDDDLTDFPVYVDLADLSATFWATTPSAADTVGTDIRVTTNSGAPTELPRELVYASSTLQTGELHFKADLISSTTDTTFRIYYNGTTTGDYATTSTYGAQSVWSNDYLLVHHLQDDSTTSVLDSTSNSYNGTKIAINDPTESTGKLDKAQDFDGNSSAIDLSDIEMDGLAELTASVWFTDDTGAASSRLFAKDQVGVAGAFILWINGSGDLSWQVNDGSWVTSSYADYTQNADYRYAAGVVNDADDDSFLWVDGQVRASTTFSSTLDDSDNEVLTIGADADQGTKDNFWDGDIDEFRLSSTSRSLAWISAEYLNQSTTTDFYTVNAGVETWNSSDWTLYDTITIESDNIDDDLTDFPVYVDLSDLSATFWSTTPSASDLAGTDIRVTTGTSSPYEIPRELVYASSTLETGELHFKADSISSTTDTVFRIYYNGTTTGDYPEYGAYGARSVWLDYDAVWHFSEDPSAESLKDSTENSNSGTSQGSMTSSDLVDGKVGKAIHFDESNDRIAVSDSDSLTFPNSDWSYSVWVDLDDNSGSNFQYFTSWGTVSTNPSFNIYFNEAGAGTGPNTLSRALNTNTTRTSGTYGTDSDWQLIHIKRESGTIKAYINGTQDATTNALSAAIDVSGTFYIGGRNDANAQRYLGGHLDNMRLQDRAISDAWISAEYLNQSTTTDFYTVNDGVIETWNETSWTLYDTITIDADNIDDDLTDFPVYVDLADLSATFWATTPSAADTVGTDIRVTTGTSSPYEIPRELVFASSTAQTGELHFKAPTISSTTDTTFRIYYNGDTTGDYATTSTYGAQSVWTEYELVLHGDSYIDSTANAYEFTSNGNAATTTTGQLGDSFVFDGTGDYLSRSSLPPLEGINTYTISAWSYMDTLGTTANADDGMIFSYKQDNTTGGSLLWYNVNADGTGDQVYTFLGSTDRVNGVTTPAVTTWNHVAGRRSGATRDLVFNGVEDNTASGITDNLASSQAVRIGGWDNANSGSSFDLDGQVDELRVSTSALSDAWLAAEYLNQSTTTDFYTVNLTGASSIEVSGRVYVNDGNIALTSGETITLIVGTSTASKHSTTSDSSGDYSINIIIDNGYATDTPIVAYIDGSSLSRANVVTKASSTSENITGLDLYANHLIVKHEGSTATDNSDLAIYDYIDDDDLLYIASSTLDSLEMLYGAELYIWSDSTFTAPASSTLNNLTIRFGSTYTAGAQTNVKGDFNNIGTFDSNEGTISFFEGGSLSNNLTESSSLNNVVFEAFQRFTSTTSDPTTGTDRPASAVADEDNVYITGYCTGCGAEGGHAYYTVAIDKTNGDFVWSTTTDPTASSDYARTAAVDDSYLYVSGECTGCGDVGNTAIYTVAIDKTNGDFVWSTTTDPSINPDSVYDMAIDSSGLYLAATCPTCASLSYYDLYALAIDKTNGDFLWDYSDNTTGGENQYFYGVEVFKSNVYLTGAAEGDYHTVALDIEDGSLDWSTTTDVSLGGVDNGRDVLVDGPSLVVVGDCDGCGSASGYSYHAVAIDRDSGGSPDFAYTINDNASTSDLTIDTNATVTAPALLSVDGNFVNDGAIEAGSGTLYLTGFGEFKLGELLYKDKLDVTSEDEEPTDIAFNNDGTKLFVLGRENDNVYEYDLSVAYDITTASYSHATSVASQESNPSGLTFNNDGTKMFVTGFNSVEVQEYDLSSAFDVSTADFSQSTSTANEDLGPADVIFNDDGSKMYIVGDQFNDAYAYDLSVDFDVSTAAYNGEYLNIVGADQFPWGIDFNADGSKLFLTGSENDYVRVYDLSTPYDISTGDFTPSDDSIYSYPEDLMRDVLVVPALGYMYTLGDRYNEIHRYESYGVHSGNLELNNVVIASSSAQYFSSDATTTDLTVDAGSKLTFGSDVINVEGDITNNGTYLPASTTLVLAGTDAVLDGNFVGTSSLKDVIINGSYTFSSNASTTALTIAASASMTAPTLLTVGGDYANAGTFNANDGLVYADRDAYQLKDASFIETLSTITTYEVNPNSVSFNDDGTKMYILGNAGGGIDEWSLSTAYDISTASYTDTMTDITARDSDPRGMAFNNDGTKVYVVGATNNRIYEWTLSTAWDVSSASFEDSLDLDGVELSGRSVDFSVDGTTMYTISYFGDVHQWSLSVAFDVSTATYEGALSVNEYLYGLYDVSISNDGKTLFVAGDTYPAAVDRWVLSTPFDARTGVYADTLDVSSYELYPYDVAFNSTGTQMFLIGPGSDELHSFQLDGGYDFAGTMIGGDAFYDLTHTGGLPVTFTAPASTTNTFTSSSSVETSVVFNAGDTYTFENFVVQGAVGGATTSLLSSASGTDWYIDVQGTSDIDYAYIQDSDACFSVGGGLSAQNSADGGNNTCWTISAFAVTEAGTTTMANSDATQTNNAFNYQNKTNEPLFTFKLVDPSATTTITEIVFTLDGVENVDATDFSNLRLYKDHDDDGDYDVSDEQVGGAGVMAISDGAGTITFSTSFQSTTTQNYVLVADWNAPASDSVMNVRLYGTEITATDSNGAHVFLGSVSKAQHSRQSIRMSGSTGGGSGIIGSSVAGNGLVTGGTNDGGEQIGSDPNYYVPTADSGSWSSGSNAYDGTDGTYASETTDSETHQFQDHGFSVPGTNSIEGIEVKLEASATGFSLSNSINLELSWDGGTSWTAAKNTDTLTTTDTVYTLGSPSDTWGRTWSPDEFSNPNLRLRATAFTTVDTIQIDAIQVRVYHQAGGGGSGGGGAI